MSVPARIMQPGEKLGSYIIKRQIGKGGMGVVYEAERAKDGQVFAIKALTIADDKRHFEYTRRFLREARLAAAISHPNVVKIVGFIQRQQSYFIIMEYFSRGSVKDLLLREGRLSADEVIRIGIAVARALEEAGKVRIVHRDIKPDNIMLAQDGTPRLADLGLATLMHDGMEVPDEGSANEETCSNAMRLLYNDGADSGFSLTMSRMAMGTPAYMAPEQAVDSRGVDGRADIYSLGATLYHLVCGQPPFTGKNVRELLSKQLHAAPPDLMALCPGIPPGLVAVIGKCMEKLREDRYQTAGELAEALENLQAAPETHGQGARTVEFVETFPRVPAACFVPAAERPQSRWEKMFSRENLIFILELLIALAVMGVVYFFIKKP